MVPDIGSYGNSPRGETLRDIGAERQGGPYPIICQNFDITLPKKIG
jgi:hypothetical protein